MTSIQITKRDQMHNKVYQFVVLVAGMSRMPLESLVKDDAAGPNSLIRAKVIQKYDDYIAKHEELLAAREVVEDKDAVAEEEIEQIKQDLNVVRHRRTLELVKESKQEEKCKECNIGQANESRSLYFSNEIYFQPPFQAAVLMAHEKLNTRCDDVTLNDLMTDEKYNVMFARLVTIQLLIAIANNSLGQPNRIIEYRRLVLQEKSVVSTIERKCGGGGRRGLGACDGGRFMAFLMDS